jgi:hypothetical protein
MSQSDLDSISSTVLLDVAAKELRDAIGSELACGDDAPGA